MRILKSALLSIALTFAVFAQANAQANTQGPPTVGTEPAYQVCQINSSSPVTCTLKNGTNPQLLLGPINGSASVQSITFTCVNGPMNFQFGNLGTNQYFQMPKPGFPLDGTFPFVCTPSAAPTGSIYVLIR